MHNRVWSIAGLLVLVAAAAFLASCGGTGSQAAAPQATAPAPQATAATDPIAADPPAANQLEAQIEAVYAKAAPSVVQVTSKSVTYNSFQQPVPQEGVGSGFVYDSRGRIVTNYHVVENATSITVGFQNGKTYTAKVIGQDPSTDLAVIETSAPSVPALAVADPASVRVGQFAIALGNPFALTSTLTFGVVSAQGRVIQSPNGRFIGEAIQTDAAINPGNSGGPLLNLDAQVIGVDSQIVSPSGANSGIGFAISTATVNRVVPVLIAQGSYPHPWIGISGLDLTSATAQAFRSVGVTEPDSGMLVATVVPGSPAARAGIRGGSRSVDIGGTSVPVGGDVVTGINGTTVTGFEGLTVYLEDSTKPGQRVTLSILRDGKPMSVELTLAVRPASQQ